MAIVIRTAIAMLGVVSLLIYCELFWKMFSGEASVTIKETCQCWMEPASRQRAFARAENRAAAISLSPRDPGTAIYPLCLFCRHRSRRPRSSGL